MSVTLHQGDCRDVLPTLKENSVHSVVTDPPYGLSFMGKDWDHGVPGEPFWREVIRVLKPGGHLLAFGGSRTYHRLAVAIEDAGFEIRDCIMWLYGSGFPKSRNVGKEVPEYEGWGTALKPAHEPIIVARKPLDGTVTANVREHGTGALNVEGCRIETDESLNGGAYGEGRNSISQSLNPSGINAIGATAGEFVQPKGRWPANVVHDGSAEVLAVFPDAPGQLADISATAPSAKTANIYGKMRREGEATANSANWGDVGFQMKPGQRRLDKGTAARFFYCAKASRQDRSEGCEAARNNHPTVKPTELMRYLCRLVTPPDGIVLDPFMGSGSTGKAAMLEGFCFVGVELNMAYMEIARSRIDWAQKNFAIQETLAL